ncbi:hypothetical protein HYQ46_004545 [Verticillium longisporum]|nr:hypothetical protein HYQ46_004545 [Verticillium longisporum]
MRIQREFHCGHFRWIVSRWCPEYLRTQLRCPLSVSHYEYRGDEQCTRHESLSLKTPGHIAHQTLPSPQISFPLPSLQVH